MSDKVMKDLQDAFAGESQANRKYLAFADQADKDGFPGVAKMFRAIASAETLHAHSHIRTLGGVKSTAENLKGALEGETHEFTVMYPEFIKDAEAEGNDAAKRSFNMANEAEKAHGALYKKTLEELDSLKGKDTDWYVCPVCGYVHEGSAPDACPICKVPGSRFLKNPSR